MFTNAKTILAALGILALGLAAAAAGNTAAAGDWTRSLNGDNDTTVAVIDALNKAYPVRQSNGNGSYAYSGRQSNDNGAYAYSGRGDNDMTTDVIDAIDRGSRINYPVPNGNFAYAQPGDNDMRVAVIDAINQDRQAPSPLQFQSPARQYPVFADDPAPVNDSFAQGPATEFNG